MMSGEMEYGAENVKWLTLSQEYSRLQHVVVC
jgi:hypothetical protein